ncbi:MAG: kelch repeat-containing protein, partial [Planctomycetota bacterium]
MRRVDRRLGALLLGWTAACGGGGGAPSGGPATFRLNQMAPPNASGGVAVTAELRFFFTAPVDRSSLSTASLVVEAETGEAIPGQRLVSQLSPAVVRFVPSLPYLNFAEHRVHITPAVRDRDGRPLDREYRLAFKTEEALPVLLTQTEVEDRGAVLQIGRWFHRLTLLPSGRFLVAGGYRSDNSPLDRAEVLDPVTGASTPVADPMSQARASHVQVALADGRVLVAGGEVSDTPFVPSSHCEIYDPATSTWSDAASLARRRSRAHGVRLPDGRVFVSGGESRDPAGGFIVRDDAEIYDPRSGTWSATGALG